MRKTKTPGKEDIVKIKLSSSFMARTRCKYCGSYPSYYYRFGTDKLYKNPRTYINWFFWYTKHQDRLCDDFYLIDDPKEYTITSYFDYPVKIKSYNPSIHHKSGLQKRIISECLTCDCGKSYWVFNQKSVANREEIYNRKSDRKFPQIFKY